MPQEQLRAAARRAVAEHGQRQAFEDVVQHGRRLPCGHH
ncbi:hypothetical protein [Sphingomonas sp. OK281]